MNQDNNPLNLRSQVGPAKPKVPKAEYTISKMDRILAKVGDTESPDLDIEEPSIETPLQKIVKRRSSQPSQQQPSQQQPSQEQPSFIEEEELPLDVVSSGGQAWERFKDTQNLVRDTPRRVTDVQERVERSRSATAFSRELREKEIRGVREQTPSEHLLGGFKHNLFTGVTQMGLGGLAIPFSLGGSIPVGLKEWYEEGSPWYLYASILKSRSWADRLIHDKFTGQNLDMAEKTANFTAGVAIDVLTDPLTYFTLGASGLARVAGRGGSKVNALMESGTRYAKMVGKANGDEVVEYVVSPYAMRQMAEKLRAGMPKEEVGKWVANKIDAGHLEYLHNGGMRFRGLGAPVSDAAGVWNLQLLAASIGLGTAKSGFKALEQAANIGLEKIGRRIPQEAISPSSPYNWLIRGVKWTQGIRPSIRYGLSSIFNKVDSFGGIVPNLQKITDLTNKNWYARQRWLGSGTEAMASFPLRYIGKKVPVIGSVWDGAADAMTQAFSPIPKHMRSLSDWAHNMNRVMSTNVIAQSDNGYGDIAIEERNKFITDHPWLAGIARRGGIVNDMLQFPIKHLAFMRRTGDVSLERVYALTNQQSGRFRGENLKATEEMQNEIINHARARATQNGTSIHDELTSMHTEILATAAIPISTSVKTLAFREASALEKVRVINNEVVELGIRKKEIEKEINTQDQLATSLENSERFVSLREKERLLLEKEAEVRDNQLTENFEELRLTKEESDQLIELQREIHFASELSNKSLVELEDIKDLIAKQENEYIRVLDNSKKTIEELKTLNTPSALRYLSEYRSIKDIDSEKNLLEEYYGFEQVLGDDLRTLGHLDPNMSEAQAKSGEALQNRILNLDELVAKYETYLNTMRERGILHTPMSEFMERIPRVLDDSARTRFSKHIRKARVGGRGHEYLKIDRVVNRILGEATLDEINRVDYEDVQGQHPGYEGLGIRKEAEKYKRILRTQNLLEIGDPNTVYEGDYNQVVARRIAQDIYSFLTTGKGKMRDEGALDFVTKFQSEIMNSLKADPASFDKEFGDALGVFKKIDKDYFGGMPRLENRSLFSQDIGYIQSVHGREITRYHSALTFEREAMNRLGRTHEEILRGDNHSQQETNARSWLDIRNFGAMGAGLGNVAYQENQALVDEDDTPLQTWTKRAIWFGLGSMGLGAGMFALRKHRSVKRQSSFINKVVQKTGTEAQWSNLTPEEKDTVIKEFKREVAIQNDYVKKSQARVVDRFFLGIDEDQFIDNKVQGAFIRSFNMLPKIDPYHVVGETNAYNVATTGITPDEMTIRVDNQDRTLEDHFFLDTLGLKSEFKQEHMSSHTLAVFNKVDEYFKNRGFENPLIKVLNQLYDRSIPLPDGEGSRQEQLSEIYFQLDRIFDQLEDSSGPDSFRNLIDSFNDALANSELGEGFNDFDPEFWKEMNAEGGFFKQKRELLEHIFSEHEKKLGLEDEPYALLPVGYDFARDDDGKILRTDDKYMIIETSGMKKLNALRKYHKDNAFRINRAWNNFSKRLQDDNPMFQLVLKTAHGDQVRDSSGAKIGERDTYEDSVMESIVNKDGSRLTPEQAMDDNHIKNNTEKIVFSSYKDENGIIQQPHIPLSKEELQADLEYVSQFEGGIPVSGFHAKELDYDMDNPAFVSMLHHAYVQLQDKLKYTGYAETGNVSDYIRLKAHQSAVEKFSQLEDVAKRGEQTLNKAQEFQALKDAEEERLNTELIENYRHLWRVWGAQNPEELEEIRARGFGLINRNKYTRIDANHYSLTIVNDHFNPDIETYKGTALTSRRPNGIESLGYHDEFVVKDPNGNTFKDDDRWSDEVHNEFNFRSGNENVPTTSIMPHRMLENLLIETMPRREESAEYLNDMIVALENGDEPTFNTSLMRLVQIGNPFKEEVWISPEGRKQTINKRLQELSAQPSTTTYLNELGRENQTLEAVIADKMNEVFGPEWYEEQAKGNKPVFTQLNDFIRQMQWHLQPVHHPDINDPRRVKALQRTWSTAFKQGIATRRAWNDWQRLPNMSSSTSEARVEEHYAPETEGAAKIKGILKGGKEALNLNPEKGSMLYLETDPKSKGYTLTNAPVWDDDLKTWNIASAYSQFEILARRANRNFGDFLNKIGDIYTQVYKFEDLDIPAVINMEHTLSDGSTFQMPESLRTPLTEAFKVFETLKNSTGEVLDKRQQAATIMGVIEMRQLFADSNVNGMDVLGKYLSRHKDKPIPARDVLAGSLNLRPLTADHMKNRNIAIISSGTSGAAEGAIQVGVQNKLQMYGNMGYYDSANSHYSEAFLQSQGLKQQQIDPKHKVGIEKPFEDRDDVYVQLDSDLDEVSNIWGTGIGPTKVSWRERNQNMPGAAPVTQEGANPQDPIHKSRQGYYDHMDHVERETLHMGHDPSSTFDPTMVTPNELESTVDELYHPYTDINVKEDDPDITEVINFEDLGPRDKALYAARRRELHNQILANNIAQDIDKNAIGGTIVFKGEDHGKRNSLDQADMSQGTTVYTSLAEQSSISGTEAHPIFVVDGAFEGGNFDIMTAGELDMHKLDTLVLKIRNWVDENNIKAINISGSLENRSPRIRERTAFILNRVFNDDNINKEFEWKHGSTDDVDNFLFDIGTKRDASGNINQRFRQRKFNPRIRISDDQGNVNTRSVDNVHLVRTKGWDQELFSNPVWGKENVTIGLESMDVESNLNAANHYVRQIEKNVRIKERVFNESTPDRIIERRYDIEDGQINSNEIESIDEYKYKHHTERSSVYEIEDLSTKESLDGSTKSQFETLMIEVYKDNLTSDGFPPEVSFSDSGQVMLSSGTRPLHQLRQKNETLDQTKQRLAEQLVTALVIKRNEDDGFISITDSLEALSSADTKKAHDILNSFLPGNTQARAYYDAAIEDQADMFYRLIEQALDNPDVSKVNNRNQIEQVVDHYQRFGKFVSSPYITRNVENPDYFINPALAITRYLNNPEKKYNGVPFVRPYTEEEKTQMFTRKDGNFDTLSTKVAEDLGVRWETKGYEDEIHFETPESGITSKVIEGMHLEEAWNHIGMVIPDKDRRNKIFSQYLENIINKIPQQERALFFNGGMKNKRGEVIDREIPNEIRNDVQFLLSKIFYSGTDKAGTDPTYLHDDAIANIAIHALANIGGKTVFDSVKDKFVTLYKDDKITKAIKLKKINQFDQFIKEVINLHISPEDMDKYSAQKSRHIDLLIGNPDTQGIPPEAAPLGRIAKHVPETLYDRIKTDIDPNQERQYLRNIDESLEAAYGKREGSNKTDNVDIPKTFIRRLNTGDSHLLEIMIKKARDIDGNGHNQQASRILSEFISMHPERATLMLRNLYIKRATSLPYQYTYPHSKVSPDSTLAYIESLIDVKEYVFQKDPSSPPSDTTTQAPDVGGPTGAAGAPPENIMGKFIDPHAPIGTIKHDKWEYLMRGPIDEETADSYIDKQVINNMADNSDASHDKVQEKIQASHNPSTKSDEIIQNEFDAEVELTERGDQNEIGDQVIEEELSQEDQDYLDGISESLAETGKLLDRVLEGMGSAKDKQAAQDVTDNFTNNDQDNADNFYETPALRDNLDRVLNFNEGQHSKYSNSVEDLIYQREVEQDSLDLANWKAGNKIKGLIESVLDFSDEEDNVSVTFSPISTRGKSGFERHIHPLSDRSNEGIQYEGSIYNKIFSNETVDSIKLGISFPATEPINLEFRRATNRVTGKTKFSVHNYDTLISGGIKPIDQGSPDHDIEGYFLRREIFLLTEADDILDIMSENETYDYIFGDPHTVHEELIRSEVSFEPKELSFMYAEGIDGMAFSEFSSSLKPHTVKYRPASHTAEEVQVNAATDDANAMHIGNDDGDPPEISPAAQEVLDKQSGTPEIDEDEFVRFYSPKEEDYITARLNYKRPQEGMGLEKYLSESNVITGDNVSWGWKIHIATDRSIEGNEANGKLSEALLDLGITRFKAEAGWGDEQPGKDATVYVGHRDDVIAVAKYIETKLGDTGLLKRQEDVTGKDKNGNSVKSDVVTGNEQVTKHLWVRFVEPEAYPISNVGALHWPREEYGHQGIPRQTHLLNQLQLKLKAGEISQAGLKSALNNDVVVQKKDLEEMHGTYFTGTKGNQRHGFYSGTEVTKKAESTIADKIREEKEARESFVATEGDDLPPLPTVDPKTGKELAPPESPPGYADIAKEIEKAKQLRETTGTDQFDLPEMDQKKQTPSQEREAFIDLMTDDEGTTGRLTDEEFEKKLDEIDLEILGNKGVSGGVDIKPPRQLPPGFIEIDGEVWGAPRTIATNDQGGSHKYQRNGKPLLLNSFHRSMVENATGIMNDDGKLSQFMKVYDFVHNFYKAHTLFPFPAYHVRNVIDSAIWRGYISGNTDMRNYVIGKHLADLKRMGSAKERSKQIELIGKIQGLDGNEILKLAFKFGVIGESSTESLHDVTRSNMAGVDGGLHDLSSFVRNEQLTLANLEDMPKGVQESVRLLRSKKEMFGKNMHAYDSPIRQAMDKIQSKLPDWLGLKKGASKAADFAGTVVYPMNPARALVAAKDTGIKANDYIEDSVRLSQFVNQLKLNWSPELSAHYTKQVHFDYRDLSNFEQNVMRRMFSWYSFVNKNLPFNIGAQVGQFHKYAWLQHAYRNWWRSNPFVEDDQYEEGHLPRPEDMAEMQRGRLPIIVSKGKEKTYGGNDTYHVKYLKDWFSIYDLTALKPEDLKRAAWGELTPLAKAPISWWKNYDSYRNSLDNKTEQYTGETTSFLGARMRRSTVQLLRNARILVLADRINPGGIFGKRHSAGSGKPDTSPAIAKLAKNNKPINSILNAVPPFRPLLSTSPLGRRYEESGKLKALYMFDGGLGYFDPTANRKHKELYGDPDEPKHSGQKISGKFGWDVAIENAKRLHKETPDKLTSKDFDIAYDKLSNNIEYMGWGVKEAKGSRSIMLQKEPWGRKRMPEYNIDTVDPLLVAEKEQGLKEYKNIQEELEKAQKDFLKE